MSLGRSSLLAQLAIAGAFIGSSSRILISPLDVLPFPLEMIPRKSGSGGRSGKNYLRPYPTDWKYRNRGKVYGKDYGSRECARRVRQEERRIAKAMLPWNLVKPTSDHKHWGYDGRRWC